MATLGGPYKGGLRPDALAHLGKTLTIHCTTCGHALGQHHHHFTDESRHCLGIDNPNPNGGPGCPCKQFTEAANG